MFILTEEEEDSDYEPLIKWVKKPSKALKKTTTPVKRTSVPRKTVTPKSQGRKKPDRKSLKVALNTSEG